MKALKEVLQNSIFFLSERNLSDARVSAEEILAFVLNIRRMDLYLQSSRLIREREVQQIESFLQRRAKKEPLNYILGKTSFYNCELVLSKDVLIPRPETEILVDMIADQLKTVDRKNKTLWDVGTGSGCMGISLKKKFPDLEVHLTDVSLEALEIAKKNAEKNKVSVLFHQGDLLEPIGNRKVDFVVSNPPYISEQEYKTLSEEVKDFEPKIALVGGKSGLEFYERFAKDIEKILQSKGKAFFEIGFNQGEKVKKVFSQGKWKNLEVLLDLSGHDRFFFLEKE
jgi:release factor glutamine methyltransferase